MPDWFGRMWSDCDAGRHNGCADYFYFHYGRGDNHLAGGSRTVPGTRCDRIVSAVDGLRIADGGYRLFRRVHVHAGYQPDGLRQRGGYACDGDRSGRVASDELGGGD